MKGMIIPTSKEWKSHPCLCRINYWNGIVTSSL